MAEDFAKGERRLCSRLGLEGEAAESLLAAMRAGVSSRQAVVLTARASQEYVPPFACAELHAPWLPPRVYVPAEGVKPTAHADYAAGLYYSLDLSSCWESACLAEVPAPSSSLDMCAAPGGKSTQLKNKLGPEAFWCPTKLFLPAVGFLPEIWNGWVCAM